MIPTIAVGYVSPDAEALLKAHQVPISQCEGLSIIHLDRMIGGLNSTARPLEYVIGFWADDETVEEDVLILHLSPDVGETKIIARTGYWTTFMNEERPVI